MAGARGGAKAASAGEAGAAERGPGRWLLLRVGPGASRNPGPGGTGREPDGWRCGAGAGPELVPPAESRPQGAPEPEAEELKSGPSGRKRAWAEMRPRSWRPRERVGVVTLGIGHIFRMSGGCLLPSSSWNWVFLFGGSP